MNSYEIVEKIKEKKKIESDYAVAKLLNVSNVAVMKWKQGGAMDATTVFKACEILGLDEETTISMIADQELKRQKGKLRSEDSKEALKKYASRLDFLMKRHIATVLCIVLMSSGAVMNNAEAKTFKNIYLHNIQNTKLDIYFRYLSNA